ncbi:MAG TPA: glycosyltransferase [Chitinophagaceae bacterium]|nr:glycosyltransferase [Chitinophagaceae bacterium]
MNSEKKIHIICHAIPWPADYGGVVDLFYKLKALHAEGVGIILHCFLYGQRKEQKELNKFCEEVHYYKRFTGWKGFSMTKPYIVQSRANPLLLTNLLKDQHPVLMEGIHCTAFLAPLLRHNKKVFLRLHNVETLYYNELFKSEKNLFRKLYYLNESIFLEKYEKKLPQELPVLGVSKNDVSYYKDFLGKINSMFLPVFIPENKITAKKGMGEYCLYHGNLAVIENEKAVLWLLKKVFSKLKIPFIIAGRDPSSRLQKRASMYGNTKLVPNPTDDELNELIEQAQIHVLPSLNKTGVKLKLINALYHGRHCVVNDSAVEGSGMEAACHIGTNKKAIASIIMQLYRQPFTEEEILLREKILPAIFDNEKNARQLIQWIW